MRKIKKLAINYSTESYAEITDVNIVIQWMYNILSEYLENNSTNIDRIIVSNCYGVACDYCRFSNSDYNDDEDDYDCRCTIAIEKAKKLLREYIGTDSGIENKEDYTRMLSIFRIFWKEQYEISKECENSFCNYRGSCTSCIYNDHIISLLVDEKRVDNSLTSRCHYHENIEDIYKKICEKIEETRKLSSCTRVLPPKEVFTDLCWHSDDKKIQEDKRILFQNIKMLYHGDFDDEDRLSCVGLVCDDCTRVNSKCIEKVVDKESFLIDLATSYGIHTSYNIENILKNTFILEYQYDKCKNESGRSMCYGRGCDWCLFNEAIVKIMLPKYNYCDSSTCGLHKASEIYELLKNGGKDSEMNKEEDPTLDRRIRKLEDTAVSHSCLEKLKEELIGYIENVSENSVSHNEVGEIASDIVSNIVDEEVEWRVEQATKSIIDDLVYSEEFVERIKTIIKNMEGLVMENKKTAIVENGMIGMNMGNMMKSIFPNLNTNKRIMFSMFGSGILSEDRTEVTSFDKEEGTLKTSPAMGGMTMQPMVFPVKSEDINKGDMILYKEKIVFVANATKTSFKIVDPDSGAEFVTVKKENVFFKQNFVAKVMSFDIGEGMGGMFGSNDSDNPIEKMMQMQMMMQMMGGQQQGDNPMQQFMMMQMMTGMFGKKKAKRKAKAVKKEEPEDEATVTE